MPKQDWEQRFKDLESKYSNLYNDFVSLKSLINKHQHTGVDGTQSLSLPDVNLSGKNQFRIGNSINISNGVSPTPATINIGGGVNPENMTLYSSILIGDKRDLSKIKSAGAFAYGENSNVRQTVIGSTDITGVPEIDSTLSDNLSQFMLIHQIPVLGAYSGNYIASISGPVDNGLTMVTASSSTLQIVGKNWKVNKFVDSSGSVPFYLSILYSNGASNVYKIVSNTTDTITILGSFSVTDKVNYLIYQPLLIGSAPYPFRGLRFGPSYSIKVPEDTTAPIGTTTHYLDITIGGVDCKITAKSVA